MSAAGPSTPGLGAPDTEARPARLGWSDLAAVPARVLAFVTGSVAGCGLLAAALSVALRL